MNLYSFLRGISADTSLPHPLLLLLPLSLSLSLSLSFSLSFSLSLCRLPLTSHTLYHNQLFRTFGFPQTCLRFCETETKKGLKQNKDKNYNDRFTMLSFTCLSLSWRTLASFFLSGGERYFWFSNFFSSSIVWSLENRTWPPLRLWSGLWMNGFHKKGFPETAKKEKRKILIRWRC